MKGKLPRLPSAYYQGTAYVFWTHTTEGRERLGLDSARHYAFREIMVHVCLRYHLVTPVYCLMPDHLHLLWIGLRPESDQLKATKFLRKYFGNHLNVSWEHQAHDHVVREEARKTGSYVDTIRYILENPVRADLVTRWEDYPYLGAIIPGYPDLDRRDPHFHELFWRLVSSQSS